MAHRRRIPIGELLASSCGITDEVLEACLQEQAGGDRRIGEILEARGLVDSEDVARCLSDQLALPYLPPPLPRHPDAASLLAPGVTRDRLVVPLTSDSRSIRIAVADPHDLGLLDDIRFSTGRRVEAVVVSKRAIEETRTEVSQSGIEALIDALPHERSTDSDRERLAEAASAAPVVRLVDFILDRAIEEGASDVHMERVGDQLRIRFRIDGVLRGRVGLPATSQRLILSRLKIMAGMDISVRRRPQDGGFPFRSGQRNLRVRASTLPVADGEKAVLRLLDPAGAPRGLADLGLSPKDLELIRRLGLAGQGVILAAGPTGSGKSSSLFAALAELNVEGRNIVTLEDPVEYRLPGINQVHVNPRAGLTFPSALRSILRQDPDVIMVGEIRDRETAEIAMTAAVTGHLVLSTIHTVDAPGAIARLLDMGVPPFLVAGGLAGVVAQRLVRTVCRFCRARGSESCDHCSDGYAGRTGVFQVLALNDAIRDEVARGASSSALRRLAMESGMVTLTEDMRRKIAEGLTTPQEAVRVIQSDPGAVLPCRRCDREVPAGAAACPHCGDPKRSICACGRLLERGWRYCPSCVRRIAA
jgi:type IV pilus assembly protein PilB